MMGKGCGQRHSMRSHRRQSWGQGASGRDSPEGPRTATSSLSATQAGSTTLRRHLDGAGPMGVLLQEQTIPGALCKFSQGMAQGTSPRPHHGHIPPADPK